VSNQREDDIVPGATGNSGEKCFICLFKTEKKARAQMKLNSQGMLERGGGRYAIQLAYLVY